jgi:hypothetical protein
VDEDAEKKAKGKKEIEGLFGKKHDFEELAEEEDTATN